MRIKENIFYKIYSIYSTIINLVFAIATLNLASGYIESMEQGDVVACVAIAIITLLHAMFFYLFVNSLSLSWKRKIYKKKLTILNIIQIVFWSIIATICIILVLLSMIDIFISQVDWVGILIFIAIVGISGLIISVVTIVMNIIAIKKLSPEFFHNLVKEDNECKND